MLKARLNSITLRSGEAIDISDGITVIVGPNNAGKSMVLNELSQHINVSPGQQAPRPTVIQDIDFSLLESAAELLERCKAEYREILPDTPEGQSMGLYSPVIQFSSESHVDQGSLMACWNVVGYFGQLSQIYHLHLPAGGRSVGDEPMLDLQRRMPNTPLQKLFLNPTLEERLAAVVRRAFGQEITLNRHRGTAISLHLGKPEAKATWPPTPEYLDEINSHPVVGAQGDGMRSFIGIALNIIAGNHSLLIIDEPEAFLHPPQARELGRVLTELRQDGVQIVVATHSSDIIQGLTSARTGETPLHIVRISRSGNQNHVATIPQKSVRKLYTDPLLKYSSVLDGLFYHGVVLCESEGDCTYYSAVLDELPSAEGGRRVDLHFTHCNGKDRIPQAIEALRAAQVPVASVFDIDLLQNRTKLEEVITAQGADPAPLLTGLDTITSQVNEGTQKVKREAARAAITAALDRTKAPELSSTEIKAIREAIKQTTGWALFKKLGKARLSGEPLKQLNILLAELAKIGIFLVPVGELERFHPTYTVRNKAKWLQEVLADSAFKEAGTQQGFVASIRQFIQDQQ